MNEQHITPYVFQDEMVRVHQDENGDPWFVAKDVCRVLAISKYRDAVATLDDDEKGCPVVVDTLGGEQEMTTVSESGLYALIFRSRKPEAKAFRKWVTSEVLPAIRKTGRYDQDEHAESVRAERELLMCSIKDKAGRVPMRTTQRVAMLNIALQVCKAEGAADELTVLCRYVSMCEVVAGHIALDAPEDVAENAVVEQFVRECCEFVDGELIGATSLYSAYCEWCKGRGIEAKTQAWFGRRAGRVLKKDKSQTIRYVGARLLN